jgi:hypothetical protein
MDNTIQKLLSPRIVKNCLPLFENGHFRHAAREAMVQVETALRQKGKVENIQFGAQLIGNLFAGKQGVRLRVPFGEDLQTQAEQYFKGVFSYYRNYVAHDGSRIDEKIALRILIIASELLELIDASELTLTDAGGVQGLVRIGELGNSERLGRPLKLLDNYHMPESTYDGLYESLAESGFGEAELEAVIELNLVEMHSAEFETPINQLSDETEIVEWFELTELGRETLQSLDGENSINKNAAS